MTYAQEQKHPNISVIIPTWNRSATLIAAIESALAQTLKPFEVLVCDDGSTDNSFELVTQFDPSVVKWISGARGGRPAIPRNRGIKAAKGDWLAFLDSDDVWLPDKPAQQFSAMATLNTLASCTNAISMRPNGTFSGVLGDNSRKTLNFDQLLLSNQVVCSSVVIHGSIISLAGTFPEEKALTVGEDYALWLRVATLTTFANVTQALVSYSDDPKNSVRSQSLNAYDERITILNNAKDWMSKSQTERGYISRLQYTIAVTRAKKFIKRASEILGYKS